MASSSPFPYRFRRLLAALRDQVAAWTDDLAAGGMTPAAWRDALADALTKAHAQAYVIGQGGGDVSAAGKQALKRTVRSQLRFLDRFVGQIQSDQAFKPGWRARADLYAQGIGQSYWRGATRMLPLPAMPRDGTTPCLGHCQCSWSITELEGDGNYDCTWRLGAAEHCQICKQRASDWAPLKIRDGRLV